ncbi:hypothetical protein SAMN05216480_11338 [Pustulibacterium marinum]|uniref:Uncharacterized protein n=1 Tax=Pustulibacterium marinum TaxID=1224947 RepID=A0A1I7I6D2_9FLAO|nr:hypothetical protein [Pustulibacterium marinum]SFU68503.1 hypothetical protein SAMN05216480_11338 [Pustulibacterium marinum]
MKLLLVAFFAVIGSAVAQTTYKEQITIPANGGKIYEVPGADGDAIQIELDRESGSKIDMEVFIYPRRHFFDEQDFKEIKRIITVTTRGVYVIKLNNPTDKPAVFNVHIFSKNFTGLPVTLEHQIKRDTIFGYPTYDSKTQKTIPIPIITSETIPVVTDL